MKKSAGKKNQTRLDGFFKSSGVLSSTKKVEAPKGKKTATGLKKGPRKKSVA